MALTPKQSATLQAICKRIEWLRDANDNWQYGCNRDVIANQGWAFCRELRDHEELGCLLSFASIFGRLPSRSESSSHCRTVKQLAQAGLVHYILINDDTRASHVKPTADGWKLFQELQEAAA